MTAGIVIGVNLPLVTLPLLCNFAIFSSFPPPKNTRRKNPLFDFLIAFAGGGPPKSAGPVLRRKSARESVVWGGTTTGSLAPVLFPRDRLGTGKFRTAEISSGSWEFWR